MDHIGPTPGIRPRLNQLQRLDRAARWCLPSCCAGLLILGSELPARIVGLTVLPPALAVSCVWFWSLTRASALPPPVVFLLGLLLDLRLYLPPGVSVLTLLVIYAIGMRAAGRREQRGTPSAAGLFVAIGCGAAVVTWGLTTLLNLRLYGPVTATLQALVTLAIYPVLRPLFGLVVRLLPDTDGT